jgi:hypothetical protein
MSQKTESRNWEKILAHGAPRRARARRSESEFFLFQRTPDPHKGTKRAHCASRTVAKNCAMADRLGLFK